MSLTAHQQDAKDFLAEAQTHLKEAEAALYFMMTSVNCDSHGVQLNNIRDEIKCRAQELSELSDLIEA